MSESDKYELFLQDGSWLCPPIAMPPENVMRQAKRRHYIIKTTTEKENNNGI